MIYAMRQGARGYNLIIFQGSILLLVINFVIRLSKPSDRQFLKCRHIPKHVEVREECFFTSRF